MTALEEVLAALEEIAGPHTERGIPHELDPVIGKLRRVVLALRVAHEIGRTFKTNPIPLQVLKLDMSQYLRGQQDMNEIWTASLARAMDGEVG